MNKQNLYDLLQAMNFDNNNLIKKLLIMKTSACMVHPTTIHKSIYLSC